MFDAVMVRGRIIGDIRRWFEKNGPNATAVLGISGGKDSTVTAALLARALGKERVMGVLMPCGIQKDIDDSIRVVQSLGIRYITINIQDSFSSLCEEGEKTNLVVGADARINLQPRLRMAALYMVAQSLPEGGRVINTCNRSEDYVGYSTKYGDGAGDMSVLGNYLVSEILAIGDTMSEIPNDLVHKAPSDGLCGYTDEDRFGFTYEDLEDYLKEGSSGDRDIDKKIEHMHRISRHKYEPMYFCGGPSGGLQ